MNEPLDLFTQHTFSGKQSTSQEAASKAMPYSGTTRERVLSCIASHPGGLTDEEIQDCLSMNPNTQRPRRVELVEGGWVIDSGKRRDNAFGNSCIVWIATRQASKPFARQAS